VTVTSTGDGIGTTLSFSVTSGFEKRAVAQKPTMIAARTTTRHVVNAVAAAADALSRSCRRRPGTLLERLSEAGGLVATLRDFTWLPARQDHVHLHDPIQR